MKLTNKRREALFGYGFISIWIIGFLWLTAYPLIMSFVYSLNKVTITGGEGIGLEMIGFSNYIEIFSSDFDFITHLRDFGIELLLFVPTILIISIIIALLLNQKIQMRGVFRSIFFLPVIISSGPVINELIKQGAGTIPLLEEANIIELLNQNLPSYLAKPIGSLFSQMIIILWFSGVQIVLFLAALQKVDREVYEAASIDGANPWETFWKITLPSLRPMILVSSVFTIVFLATFSNNKIIQQIQKVMFDTTKGYGYSSALAWVYFILIAFVLGLSFLLFKPEKEVKK